EKWKELQRESDIAFRDAVYKLQMQELKKDTFFNRHDLPPNLFLFNLVDSLRSRFGDSAGRPSWAPADHNITISIQTNSIDSPGGFVRGNLFAKDSGGPQVLRYYSTRRKLDPPLSLVLIDSAYRAELARNHITVPFRIERIDAKKADRERSPSPDKLETNFVYLGLSNGYVYRASLANPAVFLLGRMLWQIVLGLLLLTLTATTFLIAYRNMQFQRRLAQLKNNFISNMTHELKTPISTIKVAVEALRHFDALKDPEKTREYLDISALELYRLSSLVDKVL